MHDSSDFEGTTGKIVKVSLRNFLNHESLVFECCPNFNVIFGKNGQGKSAIVQAIALCLGSDGRNAGRNSTLANYIKDYNLPEAYTRTATVEVTLSNSGPDAFEFDIRGPYITIIRCITRNSSTYYFKGSKEKRQQISKRKLTEYLNQIRINIKSPVVYMDQELSKSFFLQATSHSFYNYYMRAAGLDTMNQDMVLEKANLEQTKLEIERKQTCLIPERNMLKEFCKSVQQFENQIGEWERAKLNYRLAELRDARDEFETANRQLEAAENSHINEDIKKLESEINSTKGQIGNIKSQLESLAGQAMSLKETNRSQNEIVSSLDSQILQLENQKKAIGKEISDLESEISQIESQELENKNTIISMEKQKTELLNKELDSLKAQLSETEDQYNTTNSSIRSCDGDLRELEFEKKNTRDKLNHIRNIIKKITCNRENPDFNLKSTYKYDVAHVIKTIDKMAKSGEFDIKPIGPIGQLIKLKSNVSNSKIPSIIERHIGKLVFAYLVVSENDGNKIKKLLERNSCPRETVRIVKTNLFYSKMQNYDKIPKLDNALLSFLDIGTMDEVLCNFLVKSHHFLTTAVFSNHKEMYNALSNHKIRVEIGFTLDKVGHGKRINDSLFFPSSNESEYRAPRFIHLTNHDLSNLEIYTKSEIELAKSMDNINSEITKLYDRLKNLKKKIQDLKKDKMRIYKEKFILESKLLQLDNSSLEKKHNASQSNYKLKLNDLQFKLNKIDDLINRTLQEKTSYIHVIKSNSTLLNTVLNDASQIKKSYEEWKNKLDDLNKTLESSKKSKMSFLERICQLKCNKSKARDKITNLEKKLTCDGIEFDQLEVPKLSMQEYYNMIEARKTLLKKMVQDNASKGKTGASTIQEYIKELKNERDLYQIQLAEKETTLKEIIDNFARGKQNFLLRNEKFCKIKQEIKNTAKLVFKEILNSVCDYQGNLVFNDVQHTLDIQIFNKQQTLSKLHVATDLKTLSGGERSCIQLSLLQSLASITYSPIHIFDELDVYMDQSTRMRNINALLEFARKNKTRQFFLVTPHYEFAKHISDNYPEISRLFTVGHKL